MHPSRPAWNVAPYFFSFLSAWPLALYFRVKYLHLIRSIFVIKWSIQIFFLAYWPASYLTLDFEELPMDFLSNMALALTLDHVSNWPPPYPNSMSVKVHWKSHRESRWLKDCGLSEGNAFRMDVVAYQCTGPWPFRWWAFKTVYILNPFSPTVDESISYDSSH